MRAHPVIRSIKSLEDAKAALQAIRNYFQGQQMLVANGDSPAFTGISTDQGATTWKLGSAKDATSLALQTDKCIIVAINGKSYKIGVVEET